MKATKSQRKKSLGFVPYKLELYRPINDENA